MVQVDGRWCPDRSKKLAQAALSLLSLSLTFAQRWDYAVGGVMSFGAFLMVASTLFLAGIALVMASAPNAVPSIFASLSTSLLIFSFFISITALWVISDFQMANELFVTRVVRRISLHDGFAGPAVQLNAVWRAITRRRIEFERTSKFPVSSTVLEALWNTRYQITISILIVLLNLLIVLRYPNPPAGILIISVGKKSPISHL